MPQRPPIRDGAPPRMPTAKRLALELPIVLLSGLTLVLVVAFAWALAWKGSDSDVVAAVAADVEGPGTNWSAGRHRPAGRNRSRRKTNRNWAG